jgi:hypothetical protein
MAIRHPLFARSRALLSGPTIVRSGFPADIGCSPEARQRSNLGGGRQDRPRDRASGEVGLERGVVAQVPLAPFVVIAAGDGP